jgi:hypothetical protein
VEEKHIKPETETNTQSNNNNNNNYSNRNPSCNFELTNVKYKCLERIIIIIIIIIIQFNSSLCTQYFLLICELTPHPSNNNNNNNNYCILYKMTEENFPGSKYVNVLADNISRWCTLADNNNNNNWQKSPFWTIAYLRRFCKVCHSIFTLDFATVIFYRARSSALHPTPNLEGQASVVTSPSDRVAQLYPQVPGSSFVAFCNLQGCGGSTPTHLHMGYYVLYLYLYF